MEAIRHLETVLEAWNTHDNHKVVEYQDTRYSKKRDQKVKDRIDKEHTPESTRYCRAAEENRGIHDVPSESCPPLILMS